VADVQRAAVEKLQQIDKAVARAFHDGESKLPKLLVPVVVVGGQFPFNPITYRAFEDAVDAAGMAEVGSSPRSLPPSVMECTAPAFLEAPTLARMEP